MATPRAGAGRWRLLRGVLHGGTGHARGDHRAAGDGPRPARRDAGPAVDGQHLWPGLRGRDHHRGGARRPVRAAAGVRRGPGDLHAGLGVLRRRAQRGLAAGRPDSAGHRAAAVMPLSLTILTGAFGPQRRGAIIGIWGGPGGLAVAGGPLIGGAVTEGPDWHWIWLNVPVGVAAVALSRARLPESHGPEAGLELPALALLTGGAASLVWGLVLASASGWAAPMTLGALGCGRCSWRGSRPGKAARPPRCCRCGCCASATSPRERHRAADDGRAGRRRVPYRAVLSARARLLAAGHRLRILPWTATPLLIAPATRRISDRGGRRPVLAGGMGPQAAGLAWFAWPPAPRRGMPRWWRRCSWPRRHLHGTANRRDRGDERGPARSARQGRRRQQHSAAARQRVSAQSGRALTGSSLPRQVGRSRLRREEAVVIHLVCRGRWPPQDELTPALTAGLDPALNPDDLLRGRLVSRSDQGGEAGCHGTADLEVTLRDR